MNTGPARVHARRFTLTCLCLAGAALGTALLADTAAKLRLVSPTAASLLAGPVVLEAAVDPPEAGPQVRRLSFFVDGREVCATAGPPFTCEWEAPSDVVAHVVRVVAYLQDGTRLVQTVRTRGLGYTDKVTVDAIQLTVVVTDQDGRFVRQLPRDAFRVFEDDRPQVVSTFANDDVPLELVAALDVSQSMTDAMDDLKVAARTFLTALGLESQVTLIAFNDNIFTLARKATATDAKVRAVQRLAPWGGTALYDVVIRGLDMLGRQAGRRALIVFSDGEDQSSRSTMDAALERVEASDATIYAVGLGRATRNGPLHDLLDRFAALSGGRGLFADESAELERLFADVFEDLSHQYLVGYQPTNQERDGAWRRVRVEVTGSSYTVRHRQGYRLLPNP